MSDKQAKKRKKQFYRQAAKKGRWSHALDADMRGFLITCNNREREAVREAYNLFNEYADQLYGSEKKPEKEADKSGSDDEDIEAALEKEVSELKTKQKHERRFQQVESGANNCIFIKTTLPDPTELVSAIFSDVYESETAKSRYIMRLLPVIGTCKCNEEKVKKLAEDVLKVHFTDAIGHTFSINVKVRNNNSMGRKQMLPLLVDVIKDLNPANHPDLDHPEYIVNVDILRTVLCLSVLKDSVKFRRYNLQEVASAKSATEVSTEKAAATEKTDEDSEKKEDDANNEDNTQESTELMSDDNKDIQPEVKNAATSDNVSGNSNGTIDQEQKATAPAEAESPGNKDTSVQLDSTEKSQEEQKTDGAAEEKE